MPQLDQLSVCPRCAEPLGQGDFYCGACGADLLQAAAQAAAEMDHPRAPANGARLPPPPAPAVPPAPSAPSAAVSPAAVPPAPVPAPAVPPTAPSAFPDAPHAAVPEPPPAAPATEYAPPSAAAPASAQAPPQAPAPSEVDFTLPPASAAPPTVPPPAAPAAAPSAPAVPPAGVPEQQSLAPDPRTADPRTMRDDSPLAAPPAPPAPSAPPAPPAAQEPAPMAAGPLCVACGTGTIDSDGYCEHCGHKQPLERDHMEREVAGVAAASDRGLRHHHNEDFFALASSELPDGSPASIAVLCDGVSSAVRSDEASEAAAEAASESMCAAIPRGVHAQQAMHDALVSAAEAVSALASEAEAESDVNAPACTIVGAVVAAGILTVGWIGDSRAYWVPEDRAASAARLTEDDSWAAQMVAAGLMNEAEAFADSRAHAITGWLGADAYEVDPHTASFKPDRPGVVVVCTDGLWNYAESAEELASAVPLDARSQPLHSAQHLVGFALEGGGHDNVTVAVIPFPAPTGGTGSG